MKKLIKEIITKVLKNKENIISVPFGKNKGLKLEYMPDLNLDMILGLHEPNTLEVFDHLISKGDTVIDIGSNIGYFSKILSDKVGDGRVFAFEPIPETYARLQNTIKLNHLKNVVPVNMAISNEIGTQEIFLNKTHYMASLDSKWAGNDTGSIKINAVTLDSYIEQNQLNPSFIKMDIEGGGVYALPGMKKTIKRFAPILFLESHTPQEDLVIGEALTWNNYKVIRVGDLREVKYLDKNYKDIYGVYNTVLGIPTEKFYTLQKSVISKIQTKKFGQR